MILALCEVAGYAVTMTVSEQLRRAVETCGQTRYRISQETGIPESVLSRFVAGGAGVRSAELASDSEQEPNPRLGPPDRRHRGP